MISKTPSTYENYHENKEHTGAGFPYNTYLCTIPLDFKSVPLHWHNDAEIIYIKKGSGLVTVELMEYQVRGGDIIFIRPGSLHSISCVDNERMEYENIIFEMSFLYSNLPEKMYSDYFNPLLSGELCFPILISPETCAKYADAAHFLDMADDCCRDKSPAYEIAVKGYLFCFFSSLFSGCSKIRSKEKTNSNLERIKKVLKYVEDHFKDDISISETAALCGFSESHFMRFFKNTMNKTFTEYLNDYRLSYAAKLLSSSDLNILDVAYAAGYNNLSYFNRLFKKKYNQSPKEYRKNS